MSSRKALNIAFEKAVRFLTQHFPPSTPDDRKPRLFHDIRVGVYLYENNYADDIVLAGLLHDAIEWSGITEQMLRADFGATITSLVLANTKDDSITDRHKKIDELISRCAHQGRDALIIKAADILDSYKFYTAEHNTEQLDYCARSAAAIFRCKSPDWNDPVFSELQHWHRK